MVFGWIIPEPVAQRFGVSYENAVFRVGFDSISTGAFIPKFA